MVNSGYVWRFRERKGGLQAAVDDSEEDDGGTQEAVDAGHDCGGHIFLVDPVVDASEGCLDEYEEEDGYADDLVFVVVML